MVGGGGYREKGQTQCGAEELFGGMLKWSCSDIGDRRDADYGRECV